MRIPDFALNFRIVWDGPRYALLILAGGALGSPDINNWWALPAVMVAMLHGSKEGRDG